MGAKATVRGGVWAGFLGQGLFQWMGSSDIVQPEGAAIGRGSGLVKEVGTQVNVGEYKLAFSFLSDELFGKPTEDAIGGIDNRVARTVLKQVAGELRSQALDALDGAEVSLQLRFGSFEGLIDGTKFGFRDGEAWFGGPEETWTTRYLNVQATVIDETDLIDGYFLRFTSFSSPQLMEIIGLRPVGIQTVSVKAISLGVYLETDRTPIVGPIMGHFEMDMVPLTGLAFMDYGDWGSLVGLVFEFEIDALLTMDIPVGNWALLQPYVGFRADMLSPIGGSFDASDPNAPLLLAPDYLLWGPIAGLEVTL